MVASEIIQSRKPMKMSSVQNANSMSEEELSDEAGDGRLLREDQRSSYVSQVRKNEDQCMRVLTRLEKDALKDFNGVNAISNTSKESLEDLDSPKTLEDENKHLKKIISDLQNELKIIRHMKISAKHLNSQILSSKYEVRQDGSMGNELETLQQKFQDLAFIGCCSNNISPFGIFRSFVELFVENIPIYSEQPHSKDEILCFSQCTYYMICSSFQHSTKYFFEVFIDELNKQAPLFQENLANVLYILSNLIELRCLFKERLDTLKSIFRDGSEAFKELAKHPSLLLLGMDPAGSPPREETTSGEEILGGKAHERMQSVSADFSTEVDFTEYILKELDVSIRNLMDHLGVLLTESLSDILPHAILDYEPLKEINNKTKAIKKWLFPGPSISRMIQYLEYFRGIADYYYLPPAFALSIISFSLSVADQITFNSVVMRKKFLSFSKCYEIKYNLAEIEKFCFNIGFRDGFLNLLHVNEAMKIASAISRLELLQEPKCASEGNGAEYHLAYNAAQEIIDNSFLNSSQISSIVSKFHKPVFEYDGQDLGSCKLVSPPKISCPDMSQCSSESRFVEPSYLPQKSLSKILQYFHNT